MRGGSLSGGPVPVKSGRAGWVPGCAAALGLALAAAPALAQAPGGAAEIAAPCLTARPELDAFRAAFVAAGWTETAGTARTPALWALSESRYATTLFPALRDSDDYAEFIERAHMAAERDPGWMLVMIRDGIAAGLVVFDANPGTMMVNCHLSAAELPGMAEMLAGPGARGGDPDDRFFASYRYYVEEPDLPGYVGLRYDWFKIAPPFTPDPPLLGAQSLIVGYVFDKANPPSPVAAPGKSGRDRNVRSRR